MAGGTISGVVGQIRWSYYVAATLEGYTVTRSTEGAWSLRAIIVLADAFKIKQRPLVFVAPHAKGEWRWPIMECDIVAGQLTARLGPPEG